MHENPADCVSRGILPGELESFSLWWEGSSIIRAPRRPTSGFQCKSVNIVAYNFNINVKKNKKVDHWELLNKYSDLQKLLRVTSYVLRFIDKLFIKPKLKSKIGERKNLKLLNNCWFQVDYQLRCFITPSVCELVRARLVWIFIVQQAHFKNNIKYLESGRDIENSNLKSIDPCMDKIF